MVFVSDFVTRCSTQVVNRLWSVLRLLLGKDLGYSSIASYIAVYSRLAGTELNDALRDDKFPVLFVLLSNKPGCPLLSQRRTCRTNNDEEGCPLR